MALEVTQVFEDQYEIRLSEVEKAWVELLKKRLLCEDVTVIGMALTNGLADLIYGFGGESEPAEEEG